MDFNHGHGAGNMGQYNLLPGNGSMHNGGLGRSNLVDHSAPFVSFEVQIMTRMKTLELNVQSIGDAINDIRSTLLGLERRLSSNFAVQIQRSMDELQESMIKAIEEKNSLLVHADFPSSSRNIPDDQLSHTFSQNMQISRPSRHSATESHGRSDSMFDTLDLTPDIQPFNFASFTEPFSAEIPKPIEPRSDFGSVSFPVLKSLTKRPSDLDIDMKNNQANSKVAPFDNFYSIDNVTRGLKDGSLFLGVLSISKKNRQEASVIVETDSGNMTIMILGENARNRSLEGDFVVVRLLSQDFWDNSGRNRKYIVPYKAVERDYSFWNPNPDLVSEPASEDKFMFGNFGGDDQNKNDTNLNTNQESFAAITSKFYPDDTFTVNAASQQVSNVPAPVPSGKVVAILNEDRSQEFKLRSITRRFGQPLVGFLVPRYGFDNPKLVRNEPLPKSENTVEFRPLDNRFPFLMIQRDDLPKQFVNNPFSFKTPCEKLVVCAIKGWFEGFRFPLGRFIKILGDSYNISAETEALVKETGCTRNAENFNDKILTELHKICDGDPNTWQPSHKDLKNRLDMTNELVFALSDRGDQAVQIAFHCKQVANDTYEVGVHVADVSAFVHENTALDLEAFSRGTNVHLVNTELPMLPTVLTEQLCPLVPGGDRLCFSSIFYLTSSGQIVPDKKPWFSKTLIRPCALISYDLANDIIKNNIAFEDFPKLGGGGQKARKSSMSSDFDVVGNIPKNAVVASLKTLAGIGRARKNERFSVSGDSISHGKSLELRDMNLSFKTDASGEPIESRSYKKSELQSSVEEFEILANYFAAEKLLSNSKELAFLHKQGPPEINEENIFWQALCLFGLPDPRKSKISPEHFQKVLTNITSSTFNAASASDQVMSKVMRNIQDNFAGLESSSAIAVVSYLLRSTLPESAFELADSTTLKISGKVDLTDAHWLLNVPYYTGFTSPFTRYADITVHRLLHLGMSDQIRNQTSETIQDLREKLGAIGTQVNTRIIQAKEARRRSEMLFLCSLVRKKSSAKKMIETTGVVIQFGQKNLTLFLVDYDLTCKVNVFVDWHADGATTYFNDGFTLQYKTDHKDETKIVEPSRDLLEKARERAGVSMLIKFTNQSSIEMSYGMAIKVILKPQVERKRVLGFRTDFVSMVKRPSLRKRSK